MIIVLRLLLFSSLTHATYLYFDRDSYELSLSEATPTSTRIAWITAMASPSLSIEYQLHGDANQTFALNIRTGELVLLDAVDYEVNSFYQFTIEARSTSGLIAPCFSELLIRVLNVNDHSPEINLMVYPSSFYEQTMIRYDSKTFASPFATINIRDLDESSVNLTLALNDTEHFQMQLIRRMKNTVVYLLSTKNNAQLRNNEDYYLGLNSCDNDRPLLCTNQSYRFHFVSNDYLCQLSATKEQNLTIDMKEDRSGRMILIHRFDDEFCETSTYSIDDIENFFVNSSSGELYTLKKFHRLEQSIYRINVDVNRKFRMNVTVRLLDQEGHIPFLTKKKWISNQQDLSSVHVFNSTACRPHRIVENYFQLLENCTIVPLVKPPIGEYLFRFELLPSRRYQDTFRLEIEEIRALTSTQARWVVIVSIILGIFLILGIIIIGIILLVRQKEEKLDPLDDDKQKTQTSSSSSSSNEIERKYDATSPASKLKVHDDYELPEPTTSTTIYLVQKSSPALSSLSPGRDDEGYSGSSDASDHHGPLESTIISANELLEQYRIHEFHPRPLIYDVPRRPMNSSKEPDVSLV